MKTNERKNHRIFIPDHARDQAVLRINVLRKDANGLIAKMYYNGLPFGAAFGDDFLLEYRTGSQYFVLVCSKYSKNSKYDIVIKTVLTKEQAIINLEHHFFVNFQESASPTKNQLKEILRKTSDPNREYINFLRQKKKC